MNDYVTSIFEEILKFIPIKSDDINLSKVAEGWFCDLHFCGNYIEGEIKKSEVDAAISLLSKVIEFSKRP